MSSDLEWPPALHAAAPDSVRKWLDYERPGTHEVIVSAVQVPTRDGVHLAGVLYRPKPDGMTSVEQFPGVISEFAPYALDGYEARHRYLAERGYLVLVCNVRGSGDSEGVFETWFTQQETRDNVDLIEWLAAQEFCTGAVAQIGDSYASVTAYRAAAQRPRALRTIVPVVSPADIFGEYVSPGGVPTGHGAWWAGAAAVIDDAARVSTLRTFQDNTTRTAFWEQVAVSELLDQVEVPVLHVSGYYDIFRRGGYEALRQRPDRTWALYGPWTHYPTMVVPGEEILPGYGPEGATPVSFGPVLQWLDHHLDPSSPVDLPPARVVSYESTTVPGGGRWTTWQSHPAAGQTAVLYPAADGTLSGTAPVDGSTTTYAVNAYDGPSADLWGSLPSDPAQDQALSETTDRRPNGRYQFGRTSFALPPAEVDVVIAGRVAVDLRAAITASDTFFVVRLIAETADGRMQPIERAHLRASLGPGSAGQRVLHPGEPVDYRLELGVVHWRLQAGERLRVSVSAGDVPMMLPLTPAGLVTIHHGEHTALHLHSSRPLV